MSELDKHLADWYNRGANKHKDSDEMNPNQYYYSPVHRKYKHFFTGKELSEESFEMWFGDSSKGCRHEWKSTLLLMSTVYDCKKCGITKEEYENAQKQRLP